MGKKMCRICRIVRFDVNSVHDQRVETVLIICSDFSFWQPHFHEAIDLETLLTHYYRRLAALCAFSNDAESVFLSSSPFNHNKV